MVAFNGYYDYGCSIYLNLFKSSKVILIITNNKCYWKFQCALNVLRVWQEEFKHIAGFPSPSFINDDGLVKQERILQLLPPIYQVFTLEILPPNTYFPCSQALIAISSLLKKKKNLWLLSVQVNFNE
jgi:hypothetical protein